MSYFEYLKNKRIAKKEMIRFMVTTLPLVNEINEKNRDIARFALNLFETCKSVNKEDLINTIIIELCSLFKTTKPRLLEMVEYLMSLSPSDIQKILISSAVNTNTELRDRNDYE